MIQARVDALTINFRVRVRSSARLIEGLQTARELSVEFPISAGGVAVALRPRRSTVRVPFRNADVRGLLELDESDCCVVSVSAESVFLATHPLHEAIALCRAVAGLFGTAMEQYVARLDLCTDIEGWIFCSAEPKWVGKGCRNHEVFFKGDEPTGYGVARGNPLHLRVYNKLLELADSGDADKRAIELAAFTRGGWRGGPITRVEFQLRTEVLRQFGLLDPDKLGAGIDAVWSYCARKWVRLVVPGTASRTERCALDPLWVVVQGVTFTGIAEPASRDRTRAGLSSQQLLGNVVSYVAAAGALPPGLGETDPTRRRSSEASKEAVADVLRQLLGRALELLAGELCLQRDPTSVLARLKGQLRGARARFSVPSKVASDSTHVEIESLKTRMQEEDEYESKDHGVGTARALYGRRGRRVSENER